MVLGRPGLAGDGLQLRVQRLSYTGFPFHLAGRVAGQEPNAWGEGREKKSKSRYFRNIGVHSHRKARQEIVTFPTNSSFNATMKITDQQYLPSYSLEIGPQLEQWFEQFDFSDDHIDLGYNTKAAAVYSSNIEGNTIDLNAFMNSMLAEKAFKPKKEVQEIKDLIAAYEFAQTHDLTQEHFLKAYKKLSSTLLIREKRGSYRTDRTGVFDSYGLVYLAIEPDFVEEKMKEFFDDLDLLLAQDLSLTEVFYHAALIHLILVHIHPFWDGNGRSARLLEKWFLSKKINSRAWKLQSERCYKDHLQDYYQNINLGVNYYELNYNKSLSFLKMLPNCLMYG